MFIRGAASLSRPQKTSSPTFQVPSWRTAVPDWPLATDVPAAVMSYFTVALVAEVSVTASTLEETADASGLAANAVTAAENLSPFSSSCSRLLFGVAELKNASQLVLISAIAAELPPLAAVELEPPAGVAAADDDGALLVVVAGGELEPPLEQAARVDEH